VSCRNKRNTLYPALFTIQKKTLQLYYLFGCSIGSELEAKIYNVLMTSYVLLGYFKVPNGPVKVSSKQFEAFVALSGLHPK